VKEVRRPLRRALALLALCAPCGSVAACGEGEVRRHFEESDALFANPGQGWMSFERAPGRDPRLPYSVAYLRIDWQRLEPAEGQYDWSPIERAIAAWKPRRATVALRVMTANPHSAGYYSSPKWLFDAGCRGFEYVRDGADAAAGGGAMPRIEPDYSDPIYLARHGAFIEALGRRWDGDADLEFLDVGSYGVWGEWHTPHPVGVEVRRQILDTYLRAFPRTQLVMLSGELELLEYALERGTGVRRDGVGSTWHAQNWVGSKTYAGVPGLAEAWKRAPLVFEFFGSHAYLQQRGWSFEDALRFVRDNHGALVLDNLGEVPPEALPGLQEIARVAGYRFVLRELVHGQRVRRGGTLRVQMRWANVGVAKLYRPFTLQILLLEPGGEAVFRHAAAADPREWLPGEHPVTETLALPKDLRPGEYGLAVALVDAAGQRPPIRLAIEAPEAEGRYEVGRVRVR
jgi:hypothetical protein